MRYDVGRFRRPMRRSTEGQMMSLISLGDGSTLTLDFTTGQLDPRLTFSRTSNATFINSGGLVEWAAANNFTNSTFSGSSGTTIPNWSFSVIAGAATVSLSGTALTITCTTATRARVVQSIGTGTGLPVTTQVRVTARSMAFPLNEVLAYSVNGSSGDQYKVNGVNQISSYTGWSVGDVISLTCIPTSGAAAQAVIGIGASAAQPAGQSITITDVQAEPGTAARTVVSTGTSGSYQAPRFDHDPTTLAPRGLLIEGTATNLGSYSEDFSNAAWTKSGTNGTMPLTGTAPDNNAASRLLEENTTSYAKHSLERAISISAGIHTLSVWLKEPSTNSRRYAHIQLADGQATAARYTIVADLQTGTITASGANNGTAGAPTGTGHSITAYPNGWYRVTISMNHVASPSYPAVMLGDSASLFGGNNQPFYSATTPYKGLLVWGAQLEAGSGASSYIPTGASTVQRLADECQLLDLTTMGFNASEGTIYTDVGERRNTGSQRNYTFLPASGSNNQIFEGSGTALNVYSSGSFVAQIGTSLLSASRIAAVYKVNDYAVSINGAAVVTDTSGAVPSSLTKLTIGGSIANAAAYANGHIRVFKYWPTRLPNATLQSLAT